MILLPRGNPVKENVNPGKVNLPEALDKLRQGKFTGYLRFDFAEGTGVFIFQAGRLISSLFETPRENLIAYDAIARTFHESINGEGRLDIYRLSPELAFSIHALLHGEVLHRSQDLQLIDIRSLLTRMRDEQRSGCLRIYSRDHIALIFYRDGRPLGFFHDGSTDIETTADTSMSVAREPGAKVDVLITRGDTEKSLADLMETANIAGLWNKAVGERQRQREEQENAASRTLEMREAERRQKTLALFQKAAQQHLGKIGASLVEKEFDRLKLNGASLTESQLAGFYDNLAKAAKLVAGPSKIDIMLDEMKKGVRTLLKGT
jgi:hypothetical protein